MDTIFAYASLIMGLILAASAFRLAAQHGKVLLLPSLAFVLAGGSRLLAPTFPEAMIVGPGLSVVILIAMVAAVGPQIRATIKAELWLCIGLLAALGASVATEFIQVPQAVKQALLVVVGILGAAFIGVTITRLISAERDEQQVPKTR